jgi:ArsR family transcriptional regulator
MIEAVTSVSRDELIGVLRRHGAVLLDVLSPESFAAAHLPGAMNLPLAEIARRARAVVPDLQAPIVVYCGGPT